MLANASVTAGTKGKVRRSRTLADNTIAIVDLLFLLVISGHQGSVGRARQPAVRIPLIRVGEVGRVGATDARSSEKDVRRGNDIFGTGDGHRLLDLAHDGVDRGVQAESLLDNSLVQGQLGEILVLEGRQIGAQGLDLLLVEVFDNLGVLSKTEHDPRAGGGRRVLASHEKGNHHVGNLVVRNRVAVLVDRLHEVLQDIQFLVIITQGSSFLDGIHVDLGNGALSVITLAVPGERSPVEHKVDGGEAHVEVVVQIGQ